MKVLKEERQKQNISHENLAKKANIHRTAMSHIEGGIRKPGMLTCLKIARALGMELSELLNRAEKVAKE